MRSGRCRCPKGFQRVRRGTRRYRCVRQPDGRVDGGSSGGRRTTPKSTSVPTTPPQITSPGRSDTAGDGDGGAFVVSLPDRRPPGPPPPDNQPINIAGEVMVSVPGTATDATPAEIAADYGLTVRDTTPVPLLNETIVLFGIPGETAAGDVADLLTNDPRVSGAQPNFAYRPPPATSAGPVPADTLPPVDEPDDGDGSQGPTDRKARADEPIDPGHYDVQYALRKLGAPTAHNRALGRRTTVAVIDSGIDGTHPDLTGAITAVLDTLTLIEGAQVSPGDQDASDGIADIMEARDENGHGTAVAGIIAGRGLTVGIAPAAELLAVRAFAQSVDGDRHATSYRLLKGINWSLGQDARVLNMSFVGPEDPLIARAIAAAQTNGALIVAAAGNNGPEAPPAFPAAYPKVIAVTATDPDDNLYDAANRGDYITVAAPGVDILAPAPGDAHEIRSGTSFAAAYVSGVVALMLEVDPDLSANEVRAILGESATDLGPRGIDSQFGAGRVSADAALSHKRLNAD